MENGYEIMLNFLKETGNGLSSVISQILGILKGILIDFPIAVWSNCPYKSYNLFYYLVVGSILVYILMKIHPVRDFIAGHGRQLLMTGEFNVGIATHLIIMPNLLGLVLSMLLIVPTTLFCGWLVEKGYMNAMKLDLAFSVNMVAKWVMYKIIYKGRQTDKEWIMGAGPSEASCLLFLGLWSFLPQALKSFGTFLTVLITAISLIISLLCGRKEELKAQRLCIPSILIGSFFGRYIMLGL